MSSDSQSPSAPPPSAPESPEAPFYYVQGKTGPKFKISQLATEQSELLKGLISNLLYPAAESETHEPIPLEIISGETVEKVVAWCERHQGEPKPVDDHSVPKKVTIPEWDQKFLDGLNNQELFDIIVAANYLDIEQLMNFACKKVALMIKGKSPTEMRMIYGIPTDADDEEAERQKLRDAAKVVLGQL